ncbi:polymorphic toxin-type HINT domain-containing protein, partial [Paludisphaera rhizosphaerae]|uniref:polymorphic toxin-type HINT domain-containing protein n=1 Tax=Paludisphaera rhizosphaerae TaxID=2711216 RepID=UPI0013EB93FC
EAAVAAAGRDADAQVKLALWCEAHGMAAERLKHLTRAVLLAPDNAKARGLLGQVQRDGKWMRPQDVPRAIERSPDERALMDEYAARRVKAKDEADDQFELALWCEEKGLTQPMVAHLHRTVQLDPGRDGAWRRLGFKKVGKRWVDPEFEAAAKADREAQEKADKEWKPRLERLRLQVEGKGESRRENALAELAAIRDPRSAPMIYQVFGRSGDVERHRLAVDVLSRIEGPIAASALARVAIESPHAIVRSDAATVLQRRDPREFAGLLATLVRDEVKYKVKRAKGVGEPSELLIEGRYADVRRIYRPTQEPFLAQGDQIILDKSGNPVIRRPHGDVLVGPMMGQRAAVELLLGDPDVEAVVSGYQGERVTDPVTGLPMVPREMGLFELPSPISTRPIVPMGLAFRYALSLSTAPAWAALQHGGSGAGWTSSGRFDWSAMPGADPSTWANGVNPEDAARVSLYATGQATLRGRTLGLPEAWHTRAVYRNATDLDVVRLTADARASSLVARDQLEGDIAAIEARNESARKTNECAVAVLKRVSGENRGADRQGWMDWVLDLHGYGQPLRNDPPRSSVVEEVPLNYTPQSAPKPTVEVLAFRVGPSCFAGGTPVRTQQGDRPIESIRPGDLVLSQDTTTGKLSYQPVVEVLHNPPNWTYKIDLGGGESVHPTGIHRFWKAGHGWIMAREIKAGDKLRTVGGVVEVVSAEKEKVQPVFNLLLSGGDNYCVGGLGLVAHDNGFVEPVAQPFDGVPATAELTATSKP